MLGLDAIHQSIKMNGGLVILEEYIYPYSQCRKITEHIFTDKHSSFRQTIELLVFLIPSGVKMVKIAIVYFHLLFKVLNSLEMIRM